MAGYVFADDDDEGPVRVKSIFDREERHLIDWETFGRISDYINNLYSTQILSRIYGK